jgi:hypothetical protein
VGLPNGHGVEVRGLLPLVKELQGPVFRQVNAQLRDEARWIADQIAPEVRRALLLSNAPQAPAFVQTVRSKRDRVPVVVIGASNPKLSRFSRRGPRKDGKARIDSRWRRGAMAHGIIYGPKSGQRAAPPAAGKRRTANVYRLGRNEDGGAVMRSIHSGPAFRGAVAAYTTAYRRVLRQHGFRVKAAA